MLSAAAMSVDLGEKMEGPLCDVFSLWFESVSKQLAIGQLLAGEPADSSL